MCMIYVFQHLSTSCREPEAAADWFLKAKLKSETGKLSSSIQFICRHILFQSHLKFQGKERSCVNTVSSDYCTTIPFCSMADFQEVGWISSLNAGDRLAFKGLFSFWKEYSTEILLKMDYVHPGSTGLAGEPNRNGNGILPHPPNVV